MTRNQLERLVFSAILEVRMAAAASEIWAQNKDFDPRPELLANFDEMSVKLFKAARETKRVMVGSYFDSASREDRIGCIGVQAGIFDGSYPYAFKFALVFDSLAGKAGIEYRVHEIED